MAWVLAVEPAIKAAASAAIIGDTGATAAAGEIRLPADE
jgi:hypothetical protein